MFMLVDSHIFIHIYTHDLVHTYTYMFMHTAYVARKTTCIRLCASYFLRLYIPAHFATTALLATISLCRIKRSVWNVPLDHMSQTWVAQNALHVQLASILI